MTGSYAKAGKVMTAFCKNCTGRYEFTYVWQKIRYFSQTVIVITTSAGSQYLYHMCVRARKYTGRRGREKDYCSKLSVVYYNTEDGYGIYKQERDLQTGATMRIQGNRQLKQTKRPTLYDGGISIPLVVETVLEYGIFSSKNFHIRSNWIQKPQSARIWHSKTQGTIWKTFWMSVGLCLRNNTITTTCPVKAMGYGLFSESNKCRSDPERVLRRNLSAGRKRKD